MYGESDCVKIIRCRQADKHGSNLVIKMYLEIYNTIKYNRLYGYLGDFS